ncbi:MULTISPECIES: hypothetical protein [unclassified Mesorhizobium]|uniref:hypothetical protein n=1 Tax=unclassified Mesorhizobium TaxID=325217 RepID=UPI0011289640|nr:MULTISPECIES: hypothetical protein [unclassified Mesorhizobium]MBZ9696468.1 hypothetical protein [Mesorhizobium sp. CO1-1-9]TPK11628.1 hypothetical protein FJ543_19770 [Mesorhizobium sp. B2-5-7]
MKHVNVIEQMCKAVDKATTAIVLTHNIDFLFVESLLLPRLRGIGHPQLTIFADAACAAGSYRDQYGLIERLGIRYRVVPVDLGGARRFHPKAFFLCSETKAALAVGSGNTTHGGWSANQEIWSDFSHPGNGGGSEIAAFREYLEAILRYVPDSENIRKDTFAAFTYEKNLWLGDLPEPGGLAWTPNSTPMLTQITNFAASDVRSVDVLSPYFDPTGEALTTIAGIATGNVNVLLQPRRAGLSKDIAVKLPGTVKLRGIDDMAEDRRYKFIHAKAYVLHTDADNVIAAGSANCSMAALLADSHWGNAELMALSRAPRDVSDDLLSNFSISDVAPELPDTHPADDWGIETPDLRILAARKDGPHLEIHYKSVAPLTRLVLCSSDKEFGARDFDSEKASFTVEGVIGTIWLKGVSTGGAEILSSPSWVDDERSLRMAGPERQIREKLDDAAARGSLTGVEFLQILELFDQHVQRPVATGTATKRSSTEELAAPIRFTEDDIYSDGFGKPPSLFNAAVPAGFSETDTLALFLSFFQTKQEATRRYSSAPRHSDEENEDENKEEQVQDIRVNESEKAKLGAKILRVLKKIELALARPEFIAGRPASRLSADIAFISLLMTKSRSDGYISPEEFRLQTLQIWKVLFFGSDGFSGIVPRQLESLTGADKDAFLAELSGPKLSAAMALWCMMEWDSTALDARNFRFASASLAARYFWLAQGGTVDEINAELDRIATKILPLRERERLFRVWADWVKDGQALETLTNALASKDQKELADICLRTTFEEDELAWQNGKGFCSVASTVDRRSRDRAELIPVNQSVRLKVKTTYIAPVREILAADIGVSENVKRHVFVLIHAAGFDLSEAA